MSTADTAPPSKHLQLTGPEPALFLMADSKENPSNVSVPGSSNFDLTLFDVTATGTVMPAVPGTLTLTLYGASKKALADASSDPATWLPLGSAVEPIGAEGELPETMWMVRGKDLMIFTGSGRMQGTIESNVANHPMPPIDLEHRPGDITNSDPLYVFAIGASFAPTAAKSKGAKAAAAPKAEGDVICTLTLANFTVSA